MWDVAEAYTKQDAEEMILAERAKQRRARDSVQATLRKEDK